MASEKKIKKMLDTHWGMCYSYHKKSERDNERGNAAPSQKEVRYVNIIYQAKISSHD